MKLQSLSETDVKLLILRMSRADMPLFLFSISLFCGLVFFKREHRCQTGLCVAFLESVCNQFVSARIKVQ